MTTLNQKNKQIEKQPLEYYLNLQYPVTLYPDQEGGYVAQIKDLPGCLTQGETLDETIANIQEARELWIETAYEAGDEIPLPSTDDTYGWVSYSCGCLNLYIVVWLRRQTEKM